MRFLKLVLDKVEKMETKISNAKSMNGGFDKLMIEVEHIKETQSDILDGVRGVKQNLYEPDSGLFSRVKELGVRSLKLRNAYVKGDQTSTRLCQRTGCLEETRRQRA